ncbi:MAG: hypothetical protein ACXWZZ_00290 [Solirubrobacteraceae bacterium]
MRIAPVGAGAPVEAEFQVTATDCRLAALSALPSARDGVVLTVASGGSALQAIELTPGSGRLGARRAALLSGFRGLPPLGDAVRAAQGHRPPRTAASLQPPRSKK